MKTYLGILPLLLLFSCREEQPQPSTEIGPLIQRTAKFTRFEVLERSPERQENFELMGQDLLGRFKLHPLSIDGTTTDSVYYSRNYFFYLAVVTSGCGESDPIKYFETFGGSRTAYLERHCKKEDFVEQLDSNRYMGVSGVHDRKMHHWLGRDSLYLIVNEYNFLTIPAYGASNLIPTYLYDAGVHYSPRGLPIPLVSGHFNTAHMSREDHCAYYFQVGFIEYEAGKKYDWQKYFFENVLFESTVCFPFTVLENPERIEPYSHYFSDFIIE